jgi:hypothetical protein
MPETPDVIANPHTTAIVNDRIPISAAPEFARRIVRIAGRSAPLTAASA